MRELKHKNVIDRGSAYQVHITYRDGGERKQYSRSFKKNYFATDEEAFNAACECEEQFILNKKKKRVTNTTATVGDCIRNLYLFIKIA